MPLHWAVEVVFRVLMGPVHSPVSPSGHNKYLSGSVFGVKDYVLQLWDCFIVDHDLSFEVIGSPG